MISKYKRCICIKPERPRKQRGRHRAMTVYDIRCKFLHCHNFLNIKRIACPISFYDLRRIKALVGHHPVRIAVIFCARIRWRCHHHIRQLLFLQDLCIIHYNICHTVYDRREGII